MSANKFVLKHSHVEVDYTIGITPGLVALTYKDGAEVKSFRTNQITTDQTALGAFVSVPLVQTIDTGGERFGFLLPQFDVPSGQTEHFATIGVYETFSGPNSIPHKPPSSRAVDMRGAAQTVIVPL